MNLSASQLATLEAFVDLYLKEMGPVAFKEEGLSNKVRQSLEQALEEGIPKELLSNRIVYKMVQLDEESVVEMIINGNRVRGKLRTLRKFF